MSFLYPSFYRESLLKFALSKLEIVDTDGVDLDSLGITWGREFTFELRDLGLRLGKLSSTLRLPPNCHFTRGRVPLVRVTIPGDFFNVPINIEIEGVDIQLKLLPDTPNERPDRTKKSEDSEGSSHDADGQHQRILPTPAELAQSFLETEPKEDTEKLRAALSRSQHTQSPEVFSDDEEELGVSDGFSLPSFLTRFFKGVADRLQLQIRNVALRVDMGVQCDGVLNEEEQASISGLLTIQDLTISGVATSTSDDVNLKIGKRLVAMSGIRAMIVSDSSVFSTHSRFNGPDSPSAYHSDRCHTPVGVQSPPLSSSSSSDGPSRSMAQAIILEPPSHIVSRSPELSPQQSQHLESSIYSHDGRFSDASTDDEYDPEYFEGSHRGLSDSQSDEDLLNDPDYLEEVLRSQLADDLGESTELPHHGSGLETGEAPETPRPWSPQSARRQMGGSGFSTPFASQILGHGRQTAARSSSATGSVDGSDEANNVRENTTGVQRTGSSTPLAAPVEDLSESKVFTHEEAQSMYMSVMSHISRSTNSPEMPGAWASPKSRSNASSSHADQAAREQTNEAVPNPAESGVLHSKDDTEQPASGRQSPSNSSVDRPEEGEAAQDIPAPFQNLSGIVKEVLSIDGVRLWIPSAEDQGAVSTASEEDDEPSHHLAESTISFAGSEAHGSTARFPHGGMRRSSILRNSTRLPDPSRAGNAPQEEDFQGLSNGQRSQAIEIDVASVVIKFDIACGWLLVKMGQKIFNAWSKDHVKAESSAPDKVSSPTFMHLNLNSCSFKLLEHIADLPYPSISQSQRRSPDGDTILHLTFSQTSFDFSADGDTTKSRLNIMKFVFGYASEDIISFDESLKMRESMRDDLSPVQGDILLRSVKSPKSFTINVSSLPILISLDLQQLDETLSWFGGLSTVLELGSSIASGSTVKGGKSAPGTKPRGVRFHEPVRAAVSEAPSSPLKTNSRIGGVTVDVIGEHCNVRLETSAAKVISRSKGIAIQIDKVKLSGPYVDRTDGHIPACVDIRNTRVEYVFAPEEADLDRLLNLLTPSKDKYEHDDDIMLDTLVRQRRKGAVLRVKIEHTGVDIPRLESLQPLSYLGTEMARLSTVAKYLPQDDKPGMLTLALIRDLEAQIHVNKDIGEMTVKCNGLEAGNVSFPSLMAARVSVLNVVRDGKEELVTTATPHADGAPPMVMVRFIADEMEPTVKFKLHNCCIEYRVSSITAFFGLGGEISREDLAANLAQSVVDLAEFNIHHGGESAPSTQGSTGSDGAPNTSLPSRLSIALKDCVVGLNPRKTPAKGLIVFTKADFFGMLHQGDHPSEASLDIEKASLLIIDDVGKIGEASNFKQRKPASRPGGQVQTFEGMGYVPVCDVSSASARVKIMQLDADGEKSLDVELRDDLLFLETCADSTQTLISILNGLAPPSPPSAELKYRTEIVPLGDMLNSLSPEAFGVIANPGEEVLSDSDGDTVIDTDEPAEDLGYVSVFYPLRPGLNQPGPSDSAISDAPSADNGSREMVDSFNAEVETAKSIAKLEFQDDHFAKQSAVGGTAHRWNAENNTYGLTNEDKLHRSPIRVRVRDVHVIWHLYDGYDWQHTRDVISKAVKDVQAKAIEKRSKHSSQPASDYDVEDESVVGDFLFNSVYIDIPGNRDPRDLAHDMNHQIDELASETASFATSTTITAGANHGSSSRREKLRLARSKKHKMSFELRGIAADMVVFPPGSGETQSSLDVRVQDLEIFDNVPTSTWKKFATYLHDEGERETGTPMVHVEMLNVRPVAELAASEMIIKATVLPLRLHVDQDALDFITRFFEFKNDSASPDASPADQTFIQRVEVGSIPLMLDFKPKRVDYGGLRSGKTTEFMNFFVLEEARMKLRHVILHGVPGFERVGRSLNDLWMPDIKYNQLPTVLSGIAAVRSLVNLGSGAKDLVTVPVREYRKDGRVVRSLQKGATAFARGTSSEIVKLGTKVAVRTQTVLQGAETFLTAQGAQQQQGGTERQWEDNSGDESERPQISLYADQPVGVVQGLRGAYVALERDLRVAKEAIIAVPIDFMESGSATGAAKAVLRRAPAVILRPAIGIAKATSQTLMGVNNTLDPQNKRRIDDKYKKH